MGAMQLPWDGGEHHHGVELYAALRDFTHFGSDWPVWLRRTLSDMGMCHYLILARDTRTGKVSSFDFGPPAGEVEIPFMGKVSDANSESNNGSSGNSGGGNNGHGMVMSKLPASQVGYSVGRTRVLVKASGGEVREEQLDAVPEGDGFIMPLGRVENLTLDHLRTLAIQQELSYQLFRNDCRHFVNRLVSSTMGKEKATNVLMECNIHALSGNGRGREIIRASGNDLFMFNLRSVDGLNKRR